MTTAELIERGKRLWVPAAPRRDTADRAYAGRHRRAGSRPLGLLRMFYVGRHRRR